MVHALNNNFASKKVLRKGMDVGFHFSNDASKRKVISEIWILPEGYAEVD